MLDQARPIGAEAASEPAATPVELSRRGWASALAIFVSSFLLIQSVTGLWLYFAPFSTAGQVQVLVHVVAGLMVMVPYVVYQTRHFLVWYRQKLNTVMVLGYLLMAMVIACLVSGVVVTWQSAFGPRVSDVWDWVHVVSGLATPALIVAHLGLALARRKVALSRVPGFRLAVQRFGYRSAAWAVAAVVLVAIGATSFRSAPMEFDVPADYSLSAYVDQVDEYRGNPFAPSYARTVNNRLVKSELLSHSESCGTSGCHEQIYHEWLPSAHRFAAMNPPFQAVQKLFASEREPAETRYCAGCHDPISLFAGAKDIQNQTLSAPGMKEGISCVVCHSISSVDQRGNGHYVVTPPKKYLWENETGWRKKVSDFLIRAYPQQHLVDYDRPVLRTPEFCGSCHKQFIPEALNHTGLSAGQNQFDQWKESHWHKDNPDDSLSCVDCHMRLVPESTDPSSGEAGSPRRTKQDGAHRHHGTVATNMFMPRVMKLPNWKRHVKLTEEWIRGETVIPEIDDLWPRGPVAAVTISPSIKKASPGDDIEFHVVVTNRKAGHNFTTGPLDFTRAWIHLRITDESGKLLAEWGAIDPKTRAITDRPGERHEIGNSRREGTLVLESLPLNQQGEPIVRHELWNKAGGRGHRVIFPGYSDHQVYVFKVPEGIRGPLTVTADLNYRRYRQEFLELVVPDMERESGVYQPTVTQSSTRLTMEIEHPVSAPAGPAPLQEAQPPEKD